MACVVVKPRVVAEVNSRSRRRQKRVSHVQGNAATK